MNVERLWTVYRTRFLVHARQLNEPFSFTDRLGREHSGQPGDYLVESSDGFRRITPRHLFEDIYVPLRDASGALVQPRGVCRDQPSGVLVPHPPQSVPVSDWSGERNRDVPLRVAMRS
jgi:hypothetical protein